MMRLLISLALGFPLVAGLSAAEQRRSRQSNRPPVINSFTSLRRTLEICPFDPFAVKPQTELLVNAVDPDGDVLNYEYSTTEGTISGKGRLVVWDLDNVKRGPHEVRVIVTDGRGGKVEAALRVVTVDSRICDPPPPPCPEIKVSCPDALQESKPFKFSALIIEGKAERDETLSFHWKLNGGRLVKGQDSFEIEATTTGANGSDNITATVEVGGFHPACIPTASCTTKILRAPN